jgi:hypothetical protein
MKNNYRYTFCTVIAFALTTFPVHAESINPSVTVSESMLPSGQAGYSADVTLTGLHENAGLTTTNSIITGYAADSGISYDSSLVTAPGGKVLAIADLHTSDADTSADAVVAEMTVDVSDVVDPGALTIASSSATAMDPTALDPTASDPQMFDANTATVTPEPSTLALVGSLLVGFGAFGRKRAIARNPQLQ